jgi:1-acyl-sn-glycerol-3-phosphate acyltransferase
MIQRFRATISAAPNFAYEIAASKIPDEDLAGLDLSSWRLVFNGAEPVRAATLERFAARFVPFGFDPRAMLPVYGLAECAVGLAFPPLRRGPRIDRIDGDALARDAVAVPARPETRSVIESVSCGRPIPDHEIRVVDDAGTELPSRAEGRIEFRGPSATAGYHANPEATRRLVRDGWLDTGDVGYIADGELYVTSRVKDLIKRGGHALHPYDLEAAIGELAGVRKGCVAVFGTPDRASGTERVIVVAETHGATPDAREALRQRIAGLATVHLNAPADEVLLVPPHTVLKTSSGKIRRAACRELYERGMLEAPRPRVATQLFALLLRAAAGNARRTLRALWRVAYGLYAWALALLLAPIALAALALAPGGRLRHAVARGFARLLLRLARVPVDLRDVGKLPRDRPVVVVANHSSYADGLVLTAALPIDVHWAAKVELARAPVVGFVLRRLGAHFVARDDTLRGIDDTRALVAAAGIGETVGFFPEGTFTRAPGVAPFRLGAFAVAAETGLPVVPVVLDGTRSLLRAGRWLPERSALTVTIGAPIAPEGHDWSSAVKLRDGARAAMLALSVEPELAR